MEKKETLQAVLMADNFNDHFKPFTTFNSPVSSDTFRFEVDCKFILPFRLFFHLSMCR